MGWKNFPLKTEELLICFHPDRIAPHFGLEEHLFADIPHIPTLAKAGIWEAEG